MCADASVQQRTSASSENLRERLVSFSALFNGFRMAFTSSIKVEIISYFKSLVALPALSHTLAEPVEKKKRMILCFINNQDVCHNLNKLCTYVQ